MNAVKGLEHYPGGKGSAGTYQTIINYMPPHEVFIELFLGGGKVMLNKRLAKRNIGLDLDPDVVGKWKEYLKNFDGIEIFKKCGISYLREIQNSIQDPEKVLIYADPPYLKEVRKDKKDLYKFEMPKGVHIEFLTIAAASPFNIMISTYASRLYEKHLRDWNTTAFQSKTRQGNATEVLYMNYATPKHLHDYRYLGSDFTERQHIKRKIDGKVKSFQKEPPVIQNAILRKLHESGLQYRDIYYD